jgi:5-methylcytosine-specific restriction enzyme subunit McrC
MELESDESERAAVRNRLVEMLDVALGLGLSAGNFAALARQHETLLDILIRHFADSLLAQMRRGLPRRYLQCADDLPALRGRLDIARQFTVHAVRPDHLSCRFDSLEADTPLIRIMAACVRVLARYARRGTTQRKLAELRHMLAEIPEVPVARLPWKEVSIDRTNQRWESLFGLAKLLLLREWQATHHSAGSPEGLTLLFPMNDLFEAYVAALLRRSVAGSGVEVVQQGGLRNCLGDWSQDVPCHGNVFQTKPDIQLKDAAGRTRLIIDTKWKMLAENLVDRKHGVSQADVYQLMAYARLYDCQELMLLYPATPNSTYGLRKSYGIARGFERLQITTIDVAQSRDEVIRRLRKCLGHSQLFSDAQRRDPRLDSDVGCENILA